MATLSIQCERGLVSLEVGEDETSESAARRLAKAIADAGGVKKTRADRRRERMEAQRQRPLTADEQRQQLMVDLGKLECKACGAWIENTLAAAERHTGRCKKTRTLN